MKIQIKDNTDLMTLLSERGMKIGESIQALCINLLVHGHETDEKTMLIEISTEIVAGSYIYNPAMFARSFKSKTPYPELQAFVKDGCLTLRASHSKKFMTFRGRIRNALEANGAISVKRGQIPSSYRRRPSILSSALSGDMEQTVCNDCKKATIRWYLKD